MSSRCGTCGEWLEESERPGSEHREGPIRAIVQARRAGICPHGCGDGLEAATRRAITARLVVAARGRRRRDPDRCGECASTLDLPLRATTRPVTVEPDVGPPFTVTVELPLGRCPGCGCDNLPSALAAALDVATLTASGATTPTEAIGPWFSPRRRRDGRGSHRPA